jgi:hypothetical protein
MDDLAEAARIRALLISSNDAAMQRTQAAVFIVTFS